MSLAAPMGLLAGALVAPLVLWYVLRSRRPRQVVSSTFLWRRTERSAAAAVPWQRLRPDLTFWLVLLALLAGTLALARPFVRVPAALGDHTVLILDASASMLADQDGPTRLELARREAEGLISTLGPGQEVSVVEAGARARVLLSGSASVDAVKRALQAVRPTHGRADLRDAFTLAASLERPGQSTVLHLLTDAEVPPDDASAVPDGLFVTAVGTDRPNLAVTRLQAVPVGAGTNQVLVQVRNFGPLPARATVVLSVGGEDVVEQSLRMAPRGTEDLVLSVPGGDGQVLSARVEPTGSDLTGARATDALGLDDRAFAVLTSPREVDVLLVGPGNLFLEAALSAVPGVNLSTAATTPAELEGTDLLVIDRAESPDAPTVPTLLVAPTTWPAGITTAAVAELPAVTFQADHELLTDVELSGLAIAEATPLRAPALTTLASGPAGTLVAAGRLDRVPVTALAFDLTQSNLPLQPAWPILVANTINWLAGPPAAVPATAGGRVTLVVPSGSTEVVVSPPSGEPVRLDPAVPVLTVDQVGLWRISARDADGAEIPAAVSVIAVNADPGESDLARPRPDPVASGAREGTGRAAVAAEGRRSLHRELLIVALVLAGAEALWVLAVRPALRQRPLVTAVGGRQQRAAVTTRAAAIALLAVAMADPHVPSGTNDLDVAFLVDVSDSVGLGRSAAIAWVNEALASMGSEDRAALAAFGRDARLEYSLRSDPPGGELAIVIDGTATDLASALRLGQGVVGSDHRRRVVLLTDGLQTQGDAVQAARELAATGVAVDVVALAGARPADVLVEEVRAPATVREGDAFAVEADLLNTGAAPAEVVAVVTADGREVHRETVTVAPGRTTVTVPQVAEETRTVRYEVRLASGASSIPQNDIGRAAVHVEGPARVLVVEGEPGAGSDLARALVAGGVPADLIGGDTEGLPALDRLLDYDSVVLVDVPVAQLDPTQLNALDSFVRDAGRGLVAVGGDDSYGMGAYEGTPLEDLLPVFARIQDPKKRPSVAQALVVDVSGSMAACHCRPDGFAGGPGFIEEGGINKTDISKEAIARAVRALEEQDLVGVLAFNADAEWVIPLQHLPGQAVVDAALARLHPDGPTNIIPAVREAIAGLRDAEARLRHIVLFTDGFSDDQRLVEVAREASEAGITLSVVATGEGTGEVLRDMAEAGNGRYYPGRDLLSIPDIIVSELQFAARPIITEGTFRPVVTAVDTLTDGLDATPPLFGYLATTSKPTARTLLRIGDERDPLLATWQAGLGTAVAWTSDATTRWSSGWLTWGGFVGFWSEVVKSTLPSANDPSVSVAAVATGSGIRVSVTAASDLPVGTTITATVTGPDGTRQEIELSRTSLTTFEGELPGTGEGVYAVTASVTVGGTQTWRGTTTAIRSYSAEYAPSPTDLGMPEAIALAGGGRLDPQPADAFDRAGLARGIASRSLWPLLATLALMALVADVGMRRLRLERADWNRLRDRIRVAGRGSGTTRRGERTETTESLLAARDRARRQLDEHAE